MNNMETRAWIVWEEPKSAGRPWETAGVVLTTASSDEEHERSRDRLKKQRYGESRYKIIGCEGFMLEGLKVGWRPVVQ
jgi:hypothetical protein